MNFNAEDECLKRYFKISSGGALPRFQLSRRTPLPANWNKLDLAETWNVHENLVTDIFIPEKEGDIASRKAVAPNLIHLKKRIADELVKSCCLCERRCNVDRTKGKTGFCGVGMTSYYASEFIHIGEEPEIIPSHTIFFAGCTFRCMHCQNFDIIENPQGDYLVDEELRRRIELRFLRGGRNVNLVGGNPDQHLHNILDLFTNVNVPVPVVWNSNMYHSSESEKLLRGFVDVYLGDFKYGPEKCAEETSNVKNYWDVVTRNFLSAREHAEIYIRHLQLPGHVECCTKPIMEWVSKNLPNAKFNLMFQFHPSYKSHGHPLLGRILSSPEKQRSMELFEYYGLNE